MTIIDVVCGQLEMNRFGGKVVILNIFGVDETMARTRVNQCKKTKDDNDWRAVGLRAGADFRRE